MKYIKAEIVIMVDANEKYSVFKDESNEGPLS